MTNNVGTRIESIKQRLGKALYPEDLMRRDIGWLVWVFEDAKTTDEIPNTDISKSDN